GGVISTRACPKRTREVGAWIVVVDIDLPTPDRSEPKTVGNADALFLTRKREKSESAKGKRKVHKESPGSFFSRFRFFRAFASKRDAELSAPTRAFTGRGDGNAPSV